MRPQGRIQARGKTKAKVENRTNKNSKQSRKLSHTQLTTDVKGLTQSTKDPEPENREQKSHNFCNLPHNRKRNGTERRLNTKLLTSKPYNKLYNKLAGKN